MRQDPAYERKLEQVLGNLLFAGVTVSAALVLVGGVLYLARNAAAQPHYRLFSGEPSDLRHLRGIVGDAVALQARGLIQLGLVVLVATPVARVVSSLVGFGIERDRAYVAATLIVLAVLAFSLAGGPV